MRISTFFFAPLFAWLIGFQSLASGQLVADFSLDSDSFLATNAVARRTVRAAIGDLSAAVKQNLSPVTVANRTVRGQVGSVSIEAVMSTQVVNPSTNQAQGVPINHGRSVVRIYFGTRNLGSSLGFARSGIYRFDVNSIPPFSDINDFEPAVNQLISRINTIYSRGGEGPTIVSVFSSFNASQGEVSLVVPVEINFGLLNGAVSIDDTASRFHLDHRTPPEPGKFDLYSVVLHEAVHAIGLGPSEEWDGYVNRTSWRGSEVVQLLGSGARVIDSDENHVSSSVLTPRITDGALQQSVFVPSIGAGVRRRLTELDLAFMRDLGYSSAVVPPRESKLGDFDLDGDVDLVDLDRFNGFVGDPAVGALGVLDLNGNGTVDETDFQTHYSTLFENASGTTGVVAGDANMDGLVEVLVDGFTVVSNLGNPEVNSWSNGDFNADGAVDVLNDAFTLLSNLQPAAD